MNNYLNIYISFLKKFIKVNKPLKVIFDCSDGSAGLILKPLLRGHKFIKAKFINDRPDGNFPAHGPNPLADGAMDQLVAEVKKQKADLGVILDNDGDRTFFIDETGRILTATESLIFLGRNFFGSVVVDFMIGPLAYEIFCKEGREVFTSRVGTYFIKKMMREKEASFAGEYSGHYYFKDFFGSDSGIMASIMFINQLSKIGHCEPSPTFLQKSGAGRSNPKNVQRLLRLRQLADSRNDGLSTWLMTLPRYHQKMINFEYEREKFPKLAAMLRKKFEKLASKVSDLDGIKFEFEKHWFNLRPSNTEDLIRLTVEAQSPELLDEAVQKLKSILV